MLRGGSYLRLTPKVAKTSKSELRRQIVNNEPCKVYYQPYYEFTPPAYIKERITRPPLYQQIYLNELNKIAKKNFEIVEIKTRRKIEANKIAVILRSKDRNRRYIPSQVRAGREQFQELVGSKKERCEKNLARIQGLREKLMTEENLSNRNRITHAVIFSVLM